MMNVHFTPHLMCLAPDVIEIIEFDVLCYNLIHNAVQNLSNSIREVAEFCRN